MSGIWGFLFFIGVWAFVDDFLVRYRNRKAGRWEDDPRGEIGCLPYIIAFFLLLYLLS